MLEYAIPVLSILVPSIIGYISYRQQQKVIQQQAEELRHQAIQLEELRTNRKQELIEKYYPALAENLRARSHFVDAHTYRKRDVITTYKKHMLIIKRK